MSTTHPERHLEVFTAPDIHSVIVCTDLVEVLSADGEQTSRHRWRPASEGKHPVLNAVWSNIAFHTNPSLFCGAGSARVDGFFFSNQWTEERKLNIFCFSNL